MRINSTPKTITISDEKRLIWNTLSNPKPIPENRNPTTITPILWRILLKITVIFIHKISIRKINDQWNFRSILIPDQNTV